MSTRQEKKFRYLSEKSKCQLVRQLFEDIRLFGCNKGVEVADSFQHIRNKKDVCNRCIKSMEFACHYETTIKHIQRIKPTRK